MILFFCCFEGGDTPRWLVVLFFSSYRYLDLDLPFFPTPQGLYFMVKNAWTYLLTSVLWNTRFSRFQSNWFGGLWRIKGGLSHYSNMYIRPTE